MLDANVLILNQDYQPLSVVNVKKSMHLLVLNKAEMIHDYPQRKIKTMRQTFHYPSVIRLNKYARIPFQYIVLSRKNVMKRDGLKCQYCASTRDLTIDHIIPRSRGGQDSWENLTTACNSCNNKKGNKTPEEAGMKLRKKPYRPSHILFLREYLGTIEETWKPYLYM
ncbi:MAG: HNH endonuclease [Balneolales bacterium]|nr:HNH endonuclease [Balneolales bacterium]